ncbi:MAG: hypothetical protein LBK69_00840, partial [Syntrophomonadaceae bacterium]|nr:hypothetical protein [Syntrophomonadaceae bacterium]
ENVYEFLANQEIEEISSLRKENLTREKIKAEIFIAGDEETKKALFDLEEAAPLNGLIHQFKPHENRDKLIAYSKAVPEIWDDEQISSLVIRAMIACGFNGLYIKNCTLGGMYFYGGKTPKDKHNKWTTILTNDDPEISNAVLLLLDKYLEQDISIPREQKLENIISEYLANSVEREWRYYFLKYPVISDNTWHYGEHCYYVQGSKYEWERLKIVTRNPLLGWHINMFNLAVVSFFENGEYLGNYFDAWARYSYPSALLLKNGMKLQCIEEGWRIETNEFILSPEIKNKFAITGDLILRESKERDCIEIAKDFILETALPK